MNILQLDELDDMFLSGMGRGPPPSKFICQLSNEICDEPVKIFNSDKFEEPKYYDKEALLEHCSNNYGKWPNEEEIVDWNKTKVDLSLKQEINDWRFRNQLWESKVDEFE